MTRLLAHRGPDGEGYWFSAARDVALGHRRLAIIDPGPGGYQPMVSADGRHVIVFNGEIYNFLELRRELEARGAIFRTQSDTEVILAAWQAWREGMLSRFNGMWALAIFDTQTEDLFLARDRFGIKPLLYAMSPERLVFASEQRALVQSGLIATSVDIDVARRLLLDAFGVEGSERTLCNEVRRLQGGHFMWLRQGRSEIRRWWRTVDHLPAVPKTEAERVERFRRTVPGCGRAAHAQRRADRNLSVGRLRFVRRDLRHGGARKSGHGTARQRRLAPRLCRDISGSLQRRAAVGGGGGRLGGRRSDVRWKSARTTR